MCYSDKRMNTTLSVHQATDTKIHNVASTLRKPEALGATKEVTLLKGKEIFSLRE